MKINAQLTKQENRIAEMIAWGAAKKEIADKLHLSVRTIENHSRNIFEKLGIQKSTELSVFWFCTHYKISFSDSPIAIKIVSCLLLSLMTFSILEFHYSPERAYRTARNTRTSIRASRGSRTRSKDDTLYILEV